MKNRIIAILLCACMAFGLTACGDEDKTDEPKIESESAASVNNGTLADDSVVIAVGKTTVTNQEYKVYYSFMKNQYEDLLTADVWNYKSTDSSKSIGQEAVEDVVRLAIQVKVICKAAALQNVTLAADEKEQADFNAKTYLEKIPENERQADGLNATVLTKIFEENKLAEKMYNVVAGKVNSNLSADEMQATKAAVLQLNFNKDNKESVRQTANQLLQQAKEGTNSFYSIAKNNTQGDEVEVLLGKKDSNTTLANTALGMGKNEISNVIEEKNAFYIIQILQTSNDQINGEYKNQIVQKMQEEAFQQAYQEWAEAYEVKVSRSLLAK